MGTSSSGAISGAASCQYYTKNENPRLDTFEKMVYLKQAIADPSASSLLSTVVTTADHYDEPISKITKKYDKKRVIHQLALVNHPRHRQGNHKDLVAALETYEQHIDSLWRIPSCATSGLFLCLFSLRR